MFWRLQEPENQQAWYWPHKPEYSVSSIRRVICLRKIAFQRKGSVSILHFPTILKLKLNQVDVDHSDATRAISRLKSPTTLLLVQQLIEVNIKGIIRATLLAFCEGNPPVSDGFPSEMTNNAEIILMAGCHHINYGMQCDMCTSPNSFDYSYDTISNVCDIRHRTYIPKDLHVRIFNNHILMIFDDILLAISCKYCIKHLRPKKPEPT